MTEEASKGVREHEGGHIYFEASLKKKENEDVVFALADTVMDKMEQIDPEAAKAVKEVLEEYKADDKYTAAQVAEEVLTFYAQIKKMGRLDKDKGFTNKIIKISILRSGCND